MGLTIQDAQAYIAVFHTQHQMPTEAAIRKWLHRGNITRQPDGLISQQSLEHWMTHRNHEHAQRRQSPSVFA